MTEQERFDAQKAAETFIKEAEFAAYLAWWTSLYLRDCGTLVYQHSLGICPCGRLSSEAFEAWRQQHPAMAAEADRRLRDRINAAKA